MSHPTSRTTLKLRSTRTELERQKERICQSINEHFDSGSGYDLPSDVLPFMRSLSGRGITCGVVSGSHNTIVDSLASKGLLNDDQNGMKRKDILTSYDIGHSKSSDDFWKAVVARMSDEGLRVDEVLVIGDEIVCVMRSASARVCDDTKRRSRDYDLPRRHGMKSLLLDRGNEHARPGYEAHRADAGCLTIASLDEATAIIESWS